MLASILAFQVNGEFILALVLGAVTTGGAVFSVLDKRASKLTDTYKGLYEAKAIEVTELRKDLDRLQTQVNLLTSDFTKNLAEGVTTAIIHIMEEQGFQHGQH